MPLGGSAGQRRALVGAVPGVLIGYRANSSGVAAFNGCYEAGVHGTASGIGQWAIAGAISRGFRWCPARR